MLLLTNILKIFQRQALSRNIFFTYDGPSPTSLPHCRSNRAKVVPGWEDNFREEGENWTCKVNYSKAFVPDQFDLREFYMY